MLQLDDFNRLYNYFTQLYELKGIYVHVRENRHEGQNFYIEESHRTYHFNNIEAFNNAYNYLNNIEFIQFHFSNLRLKYYVHFNKLIVNTEIFNDINVIQNIIAYSDIKDISYNLKNTVF